MQNKLSILIPEGTYHVYNRANGSEKIFKTEENYLFFLAKFRMYIQPIAEVYCYCLMPNHFHFLLRVRSLKELGTELNLSADSLDDVEKILSKRFSNLFSSYTQALNKYMGRKGSLFMKNFKRKRVQDDVYFRNLVYYIHHNPVEAGLCGVPLEYKYSSYRGIINNEEDFVLRDELVSQFEDLENFKRFHERKIGEIEKIEFDV